MWNKPELRRDDVGRSRTSTLTSPTAASDKQRFTQLVQAADPAMRAMAWRILGNQAALEDALQEAYIKAWRNFGGFHGDLGGFRAWLYRIVHNTCIDHIRANKKRRNDVELDDQSNGGHATMAIADRILTRNQLRDALHTLKPDQAAAFALVDGEGYSFDQAAEILGVPRGTVASRVSRARANMRRELGFEQKEAQS